ncbi:MBL fold metallo-hydrolase [Haloplasma contractile]|uniref:Hydroxyacylglutathione hydrolase protein n=1 Tax=Haloplasma contractile SSD-17B TaxID=1033810 RepID=U2FGU5_9MOLU|nr:MBL fold metallo-hydrolase [Haloplasma contractile]ERJ12075.1 hydroxyacylglutathione hydrolase protein [Haloplasma contractile SSD-17B]
MNNHFVEHNHVIKIAEDVFCIQILLVNSILIGQPNSGEFILIDTGVKKSKNHIIDKIESIYGKSAKPRAIILTHGHFDHIGSIKQLIDHYSDVEVYAHEDELPYLTGEKDYLPADPSVSNGLLAKMSPFYSHKGIDLGNRVKKLPDTHTIPFFDEWKWLHTPGHSPGQISLYRERDGILIASDAITTVKQESALKVLTQEKELHGPPQYFTTNWTEAYESVKKLVELKPNIIVSSHGKPLSGYPLAKGLETLTLGFERYEIPKQGKYVEERYKNHV